MKIVIPYKQRNWAKELHQSKKRWNIIIAHRRCGKTVASINHLIRDAMITPDSKFAYIAPTYKQAKNVAWDILKKYAATIPRVKFNIADLYAEFPNGSRITLYGSENVDGLRGIGLWGVVFDEYSQQPSNIFTEVISKCLADHHGYAIWIGTPKGKNDFVNLYLKGKESDDWMAILKTIDDSLEFETGEIIDNLRMALEDDRKLVADGLMTQDEFEQEWYCNWNVSIKGAYYADELYRMREEERFIPMRLEKGLPVHTWWDIGVGDAVAIGFFQQHRGKWVLIDYLESEGEGLPYYVTELQKKGYVYGRHFAPHDITVREFTTGQSRLETAKSLGIYFHIAPKLGVDDGIQATRLRMNQLWINSDKCQYFMDCISQYQKEWDDKRGMYKSKPLHDFTSHAADMLRYWAVTPDFSNVPTSTYTYKKNKF
ncbi:MAG: terminase family protein [Candidatus Paceibacterota bacterium]|jgi:hypothetical protein